MKKRIKDPLLQNTRKLFVQVNKIEHKTYDQEFENKYGPVGLDNYNDIDFNSILIKEFKRLSSAPYTSRNA